MAAAKPPKQRRPYHRWPISEQRRIVELTLCPGASARAIAREHGISPNSLSRWRARYHDGRLGGPLSRARRHADASSAALLPLTVVPAMGATSIAGSESAGVLSIVELSLPSGARHERHKSPVAAQALDRIGALYAIEQQIRGRPPDERRAVRQERSRPLLDGLRSWFEQTLASLSQKSATAKAIRYALSRWEALGRYCEDGRVEIDNNAAERALRCVALGVRTSCSRAATPVAIAPLRSTA
jgi:transposase-like protein